MDKQTRAYLIREGNKYFNDGNYAKARELFIKTNYQDGLIRMGDYFMHERRLPILAYGYYKKAGRQDKVDEIFERMLFAMGKLLGKDKLKNNNVNSSTTSEDLNPDSFQVHPILKQKALEILQKNK